MIVYYADLYEYRYLYCQVNEHIQKDCQSDKAKKVSLSV